MILYSSMHMILSFNKWKQGNSVYIVLTFIFVLKYVWFFHSFSDYYSLLNMVLKKKGNDNKSICSVLVNDSHHLVRYYFWKINIFILNHLFYLNNYSLINMAEIEKTLILFNAFYPILKMSTVRQKSKVVVMCNSFY